MFGTSGQCEFVVENRQGPFKAERTKHRQIVHPKPNRKRRGSVHESPRIGSEVCCCTQMDGDPHRRTGRFSIDERSNRRRTSAKTARRQGVGTGPERPLVASHVGQVLFRGGRLEMVREESGGHSLRRTTQFDVRRGTRPFDEMREFGRFSMERKQIVHCKMFHCPESSERCRSVVGKGASLQRRRIGNLLYYPHV